MKTNEVPQDNANLGEGKFKDVQYAVDENGRYTTVKSVGWDPKNTVMLKAWEVENMKIAEAKQLVLDGKKSPLYYFMFKSLMDVKLLASYTGLSRWKIRRHFNPKRFNKLNDSILDRYVYAFGLKSIEDLKRPGI